jgi:hypothetical protein
MDMTKLDQAVIDLHNIAAQVEEAFGQAEALSNDIRKCADRLALIINRIEMKGENQ